jgi:hypothetical protein
MTLPNLVISLDLAKRMDAKLKKAGLWRESIFWWNTAYSPDKSKTISWIDKERYTPKYADESSYSAYTAGELGEMLPDKIGDFSKICGFLTIAHVGAYWEIGYTYKNKLLFDSKENKSLAESAGLMLEYLVDNKLV